MKRAAAVTVLLAAQLVSAPPPQVIREIDLSQIIPGRPGYMPDIDFAFSPDEKWLAVTFGTHPVDPRERRRDGRQVGTYTLLLVPVSGPADQQLRIDPGLRPVGSPGWSPDSDTFFVQGLNPKSRNSRTDGILKAWSLRGKELFHRASPSTLDVGLPGGIFGFLDPEHLLVRGSAAKGASPAFEILDLHGQIVDTWTVPKHWSVRDISPDRHLLAVLSDEQASKTLIVDYPSKKVILTKDNPYGDPGRSGGGGRWEYFTEGGKTLCSVGGFSIQPSDLDTDTECWDVDSGKEIAHFDDFLGGAPAAASSHGSRLVLTHTVAFPRKGSGLSFPQVERVVWDFRAGTEVASLGNAATCLDQRIAQYRISFTHPRRHLL